MVNFMAAITRTFVGVVQALTAWSVALLAGATIQVRLVTLPVPLTTSTVWSAVTEATYPGYAPLSITSLSVPASQDGVSASIVSPQLIFQYAGVGAGNNITGAVVTNLIPGSTQATGTVTTTGGVVSAPTITLGGSGYLVAPTVRVLGGGTGAVITSTITAGVVTALNLVSGGIGYTAATIVIDPPLEILGFYNFPSPVSMNNPFNQIPITVEFDMAP